MMDIAKVLNIGTRIKSEREKAGLTQRQLSERCGIHEVQLRRYECNHAVPREYQINKIAKALGVDEKTIFNQTEYEEIVRLGTEAYKKTYGD